MLDNRVLYMLSYLENAGASFRNIFNFLYTMSLRASASLPTPHHPFVTRGLICSAAQFSPTVPALGAPAPRHPELPSPEFRGLETALSWARASAPSAAGSRASASKVTLQRKHGKMVPPAVARGSGTHVTWPLVGGRGCIPHTAPTASPELGGLPLQKKTKWHRLPHEEGHLSTGCVGKPCGSFISLPLCSAGGRAAVPGGGGVAAPLPKARAAPQQPVRKEREKTTVPVCAPDCLCGAVPSPAEASSTPHPTPTAAPHDTQESPPLALEFHSAAVWGPEAQAAVLSGRGWGRPALPGTLAAEWPPRAGLPAHTAHKWVPDPQPPTGSAPRPVCAPERVPAAVGLRGRTLGKRLSVVFLLSVWFWGNFSIFRTESV